MSYAAASLAAYLKPFVADIGKYYQWTFNESSACQITGQNYSDDENWYEKTLHLKRDLSTALVQSKTLEQRAKIYRYFIEDWGGVTTNKNLEGTIEPFAKLLEKDNARENFRKVSLKGISSWSKYISLCCDWAAIYDSRVAYSINAIRFIKGDVREFFPMPEGRSPRLNLIDIETLFVISLVKNGSIKLEEELQHKHFSSRIKTLFHIHEKDAYYSYLKLLNDTSKELDLPQHEFRKVEMLLFALAPGQVLSDLIDHINDSTDSNSTDLVSASAAAPRRPPQATVERGRDNNNGRSCAGRNRIGLSTVSSQPLSQQVGPHKRSREPF